jgi:hypothetical protein
MGSAARPLRAIKGAARAAPPTAAPIFKNERRLPFDPFIGIFLK